jgi:aldose 1-epimerase
MKISTGVFGKLPDGRTVYRYTIENKSGAKISILNYGGIIQSLYMPDRDGNLKDIVCGFDNIEGYLTSPGYQGAIIGRYSNRIGGAKFTLDGKTYDLFVNSGTKDSLHGGQKGFDKKIFEVETFTKKNRAGLKLTTVSGDGEEGYPGNLELKVTYTFDEDNRFFIRYQAETDAATPVNLTNHAYFNLNGYDGGSVMDQYLRIDAHSYIEVDADQIPVAGDPIKVDGTDFDFRTMRKIGIPFDHNFNLNWNGMMRVGAEAYDEASGRTLTMLTNMPCVQLYTGCVMNGDVAFKGGVPQRPLHAFCLETQYAPNSPNRPDFLSCILRPGEKYDFQTAYCFGTK